MLQLFALCASFLTDEDDFGQINFVFDRKL